MSTLFKLISLFLFSSFVFNVSANNSYPRDSKFYYCVSPEDYSEELLIERGCKVFNKDEVTQAARLIVRIPPKYPRIAVENKISGHVKAELIINEIGGVLNVNIIESVPKGVFDKQGVKAMKKWKYRSAKFEELNVIQKVTVTYDFKI